MPGWPEYRRQRSPQCEPARRSWKASAAAPGSFVHQWRTKPLVESVTERAERGSDGEERENLPCEYVRTFPRKATDAARTLAQRPCTSWGYLSSTKVRSAKLLLRLGKAGVDPGAGQSNHDDAGRPPYNIGKPAVFEVAHQFRFIDQQEHESKHQG